MVGLTKARHNDALNLKYYSYCKYHDTKCVAVTVHKVINTEIMNIITTTTHFFKLQTLTVLRY